jgi:molybdopterin biosynthesis enzyme
VSILKNQTAIATISAADCLVYLSEKHEKISKGDSADVILLLEELH